HLWFPIEYFLRFRRPTDQEIHFRRALITCVVFNKFFPIKIDMRKGGFDKLADAVGFARGEHKIIPFAELKNSPHSFDILWRVAPVSFRIEIAEEQFLL